MRRMNCSVMPGWSASAESKAIFSRATAPLLTWGETM
jgi:hypothetical protein